ncbi:MAG: AsmA family protein [Lysobacterales bacterium]|jgi:uncharacterized protein involved in outer membrane biogenesis
MRRFFRILFKSTAWLLVLLVAIVLVLSLIGVKVDLSHLRGGVEVAAGQALGREVTIAGPVELEFSNWPALQVSNVRIANAPGAARPDFLSAGLARMQIGVFPLLRGKINIAEITAEDVTLNLETDAAGKPNWVFGEAAEPEPKQPAKTEAGKDGKLISFTALDQLSLQNITVNYHEAALNKSMSFVLDSMQGTAAEDEPIVLELAGKLQDKKYDLNVRGGPVIDLLDREKPWGFDLKGELFGKKIASKGDMVVRDHRSEVNLALGLRDVDVGAILSALGLVEGMRASLGDAAINVSVKGSSLQEVLGLSSMVFRVKGGSWKVTVPNAETGFEITDLYGDILVEEGNNVTMKLDGVIDGTPVQLKITGAPLVEYVTNRDEIPLRIEVELGKSRISFASEVRLPLTERDMVFALEASSERIDHLSDLFRLDLPPIGPVSLESQLSVTGQGYDLSKLVVHVGDSRLNGNLKLSALQGQPKLDVSLVSELIQLDDFDIGKRQPAQTEQPEGETKVRDGAPEQAPEALSPEKQIGDLESLLSYEVLRAFDADIKIEAQDVRSGEDRLGSALLQVGLEDARLAVKPLDVNIPGGGIQVTMGYTPSPTDVTFNIEANVEEFDVGVIARRAKPGTDMGGKLTLDVALRSQAPNMAEVMANANGQFDFALVPKHFSSGVIDLWAVNLLSAIMDKSTEKDQSEINCVVVRFRMEEGLMEEKAIYLDTSNMRIAGKSDINFKTRELEIKLAPKAKKPEFFSVAIPIQVRGSFDDFGLKIGALPMVGQVISFVTSPFHVPVRRIFTKEAPADGIEACKAAWATTRDGEKGSKSD